MGATKRMGTGLMVVVAGLAIWATAADGQSPATAVGDLLGHQLDGSARWRQDNPGFEAVSRVPAYWLREVRWGPAREVVIADAFAVFEDGRCEAVAHMVYFWDIDNRRVAVNSYNAGGVRGQGYLEAAGRSGFQLMTTITLPDGGSLRMREYSDNSQADASVTHPERLVEGEWVAGDAVTWHLDHEVSSCR